MPGAVVVVVCPGVVVVVVPPAVVPPGAVVVVCPGVVVVVLPDAPGPKSLSRASLRVGSMTTCWPTLTITRFMDGMEL